MSVDMNIERSSTRLHAPPGGKSSFSLSYDEPVKAAAPTKLAAKPSVENIPKQAPAATSNVRAGWPHLLPSVTNLYM